MIDFTGIHPITIAIINIAISLGAISVVAILLKVAIYEVLELIDEIENAIENRKEIKDENRKD